MMSLAVTVATMASSMMRLTRKSKTATLLQIWEMPGGNTGHFFGGPHTGVIGPNFGLSSDFSIFSAKCGDPNKRSNFPEFNGPGWDVPARISDRYTPYAKFLLLLAPLIWPQIFPKTNTPRRADRESSYGRTDNIKPIGFSKVPDR